MKCCPYCKSDNIFFSNRKKVWFCQDCQRDFQHLEDGTDKLRLFFSYGHDANKPLVEMIRRYLEERGYIIWIDESEIRTGNDWRNSITEGILGSNNVISFLSKWSVRDPGVCLDELRIALCVKGADIRTILVEAEAAVRPPSSICNNQWLDMSGWQQIYGTEGWDAWFAQKMQELVTVLESEQSQMFAGQIDRLKRELKPLTSDGKEQQLIRHRYIGREWLDQEIEDWRTDRSAPRSMILYGIAGSGKSAFAANTVHYNPNVMAGIFLEWNKPEFCTVDNVIRTLAFKIAVKNPDYRTQLLYVLERGQDLSGFSGKALFDLLVLRPLQNCVDGNREAQIILFDGLDEAIEHGNGLIELLSEVVDDLPVWVRFLFTSREDIRLTNYFIRSTKITLGNAYNKQFADIQCYVRETLAGVDGMDRAAAWKIAEVCDGCFLYAEQFCENVRRGELSLSDIHQLPAGLYGFYLQNFYRRFPDPAQYAGVRKFFEVLCAEGNISEYMLCQMLGCDSYQLIEFRQKAGSLITRGKEYFHGSNQNCIRLAHKSIVDWLCDEQAAGSFWIDRSKSIRQMIGYLQEADRRLGDKSIGDLSEEEKGILRYAQRRLPELLAGHMLWEEYIRLLTEEKTFRPDFWKKLGAIPRKYDLSGVCEKLTEFLFVPLNRRKTGDYGGTSLYYDVFQTVSLALDLPPVAAAFFKLMEEDTFVTYFQSGAAESYTGCRDRGDHNADKLGAVIALNRCMSRCEALGLSVPLAVSQKAEAAKLAALFYDGDCHTDRIGSVLDEFSFIRDDVCRYDFETAGEKLFKCSDSFMRRVRDIYNTCFLERYLEVGRVHNVTNCFHEPNRAYVDALLQWGADLKTAVRETMRTLTSRYVKMTRQEALQHIAGRLYWLDADALGTEE